jgi:peroxiredoxin (alkyl hydroperoxide reductase subunit C)
MVSYNSINNNLNQRERGSECITLGRLAPDFIAMSTQGYVRLSDYRGKWVLLASEPMAFKPVGTTELIKAAQFYPQLLERNAVMVALTTDNIYSNLAWVFDIYQKTGITVPFPVIADSDLSISEQYGMLNPDRLYGETVRDAFIINPYGRIRSILTLPSSCGRNFQELTRILDSLQITEQYNLETPADWQPGGSVLVPPPTTYDEIINRLNTADNHGLQCPLWYVCYTDLPDSNPDVSPQNEEPAESLTYDVCF